MNSSLRFKILCVLLMGYGLGPIRGVAQTPLVIYNQQKPAQAVAGSTSDRLAAYNSLTSDHRQAINVRVQPYLRTAIQQALAQHQSSIGNQDLMVHAPSLDGIMSHNPSKALSFQTQLMIVNNGSGAFSTMTLYPAYSAALPANPVSGQVTGNDLDHDGLPEAFENQLADTFTPSYFVSGGERDNFATFLDSVPAVVSQRLGPHPLSYFRVKPLGFATATTGVVYGIIQVNYLTLWDHDSGLAVSGTCNAMMGVAGGILGIDLINMVSVLTSHALDDEHSAVLLAAPVVNGGFNLDPTQYSAFSYYTAAHEGTFFDLSMYLNPSTPIPANYSIPLALSLNKHSTYAGDPDGLALFPPEVPFIYYATIFDLWAAGIVDDFEYLYLLYVGDTVFYGCVIEHFSNQGGVAASPRTNVGEPVAGSTINGSGFILDPNHVLPKLTETLWVLAGPPPILVTVTPAAAYLDLGQSQQFQASVANAPNNNQGVTWSFNPPDGSLTQAGLYTAPTPVNMQETVTVTACSTSDSTRCGTALVFLNPIAVTVSPKAAALSANQTQQFTASVTHSPSSNVNWSLNPQTGTVSNAGFYTAPAIIAGQQTVSLSACSALDSTRCDAATITLGTPGVTLLPASLAFGNQNVNSTSPALQTNLTNNGTLALAISSIAASGDFAQSNNCGVSLAAGASCAISVTFTPTASGARSGAVIIYDNAAGSPHSVGLSGTGLTPVPGLSLSVSSLNFGAQNDFTTSLPQTITATSTGTAPVIINSIGVSGDYAQSNNCPGTLAAGSTCTINVTFKPTTPGTRNGAVTVNDSATGSPHSVSLTGTGVVAATIVRPTVAFQPAGGGIYTNPSTVYDGDLGTYSSPLGVAGNSNAGWKGFVAPEGTPTSITLKVSSSASVSSSFFDYVEVNYSLNDGATWNYVYLLGFGAAGNKPQQTDVITIPVNTPIANIQVDAFANGYSAVQKVYEVWLEVSR